MSGASPTLRSSQGRPLCTATNQDGTGTDKRRHGQGDWTVVSRRPPLLSWLEMSVHNASLTVIRVEADGRFKVLAVGDSGHLPPRMYTAATGDPERSLALPTG